MKSMTGFGCASAENTDISVGFRVEMSSVNRKQLEIKVSLPREIAFYETKIRRIVSEKISRGAIFVKVDFQKTDSLSAANSDIQINKMLVKKLIEASKDLAKECTLDCSLSLQQLLAIPGVIIENNIDYSVPEVETIICQAVSEAMSSMIHMRELEGKNLQTDILKRIGILEDTLSKIQPFAQCYPDLMYQKLLKKIREMNLNTADDDDRLQRELVIFSDKVDVTEEITRLKSHFLSFREIAEHSSQEEGRRLDFLTQEIFREINTLSNKCGTVEISPLAVIMKTEVEKIREQIQNIE